MNDIERVKLQKLQGEAEKLLDFYIDNRESLSKNPLKAPMVPPDISLLVQYIINDKYGYDYDSQPDYGSIFGAYDKFISSRPDDKEKHVVEYGFSYFDKDAIGELSPQAVLDNFKKSLKGQESTFSELLNYAEQNMEERLRIAEVFNSPIVSSRFIPSTIYSPTAEVKFLSRAEYTSNLIREANAPIMKHEHSDIKIMPGEFVEAKPKEYKVECDDRTQALFQQIGQKLIDAIVKADEEGRSPWHDPVFTLNAYNAKTGYHYNIENKTLLNDAVSSNGYETAMFLSFDQVRSIPGLSVAKGSKGTPVIQRFGKKVAPVTRDTPEGGKEKLLDADGEQVWIYRKAARTATVFNIDQLEFKGDGPDPRIAWKEQYHRPNKIDASNQAELNSFIDTIIEAMDCKLEQGGHTPFYSPARDTVSMPDRSMFTNDLHYASVALHEWLHSGGVAHRLNRPSLANYHVNDFWRGFEETLVNVAAVQVVNHFGLDNSELGVPFKANEEAYNVGWAREIIKKDPMHMIEVMQRSDEAFRYVRDKIEHQLKLNNLFEVFINHEAECLKPAAIKGFDKAEPEANDIDVQLKKSTHKRKVAI